MNDIKCCAITAKGSACENGGTVPFHVYELAGTAYALDALPLRLVGGGWLKNEDLVFCGQHANMLRRGQALKVINRNKKEEEKSMNNQMPLPTVECNCDAEYPDEHSGQCPVTVAEFNQYNHDERYTKHHMGGGGYIFVEKCEHDTCTQESHEALMETHQANETCCGEDCFHINVWHCLVTKLKEVMTEDEVKEIMEERDPMHTEDVYNGDWKPFCDFCGDIGCSHCDNGKTPFRKAPGTPMATETGPICANCSFWSEGRKYNIHHATVADIKLCYSLINENVNMVEDPAPYKFFPKDQKAEAVKFAKTVKGTFKATNKGDGWVVIFPKTSSTDENK